MIFIILLVLLFCIFSKNEHYNNYNVYNKDYLQDFTGYIPECSHNSDCLKDDVCLNYYGLKKCRKKLQEGQKCTTTNSLGFTYLPCGDNLACVEDYSGSPEVDVASSGTCQKKTICETNPSKCEYHHASYPYLNSLPYSYPYPMVLDTLLKPNQ